MHLKWRCGPGMLQPLLGMTQPEAAEKLGVSVSTLHRACRFLGMEHWSPKRVGKGAGDLTQRDIEARVPPRSSLPGSPGSAEAMGCSAWWHANVVALTLPHVCLLSLRHTMSCACWKLCYVQRIWVWGLASQLVSQHLKAYMSQSVGPPVGRSGTSTEQPLNNRKADESIAKALRLIATKGQPSKVNVQDLRGKLGGRGLAKTALKAELILRLQSALAAEAPVEVGAGEVSPLEVAPWCFRCAWVPCHSLSLCLPLSCRALQGICWTWLTGGFFSAWLPRSGMHSRAQAQLAVLSSTNIL